MEFGSVPLARAQGAILAHSVALAQGRLRKGKVLDADDLATLRAAGHLDVVVARLGRDDLHEDAAALALAHSIVPDPEAAGLRLQPVGTGRVNIMADGPGLLQVDAGKVDALNRADPALTLATRRPLARLEGGEMAGTVKVIAYGVARAAVDLACAAGQGALCLARPVLRRARLIQTAVDAGEDGAKGHGVIAARLERLGVALDPVCVVPHRPDSLAKAILSAQADLLLILTGSATSDIADTAPQALRIAGGVVDHFGMPVDPGNLLFLGRLGSCPVIGLPGCARSPALNGADWVMERVICGLTPAPQDIMCMGVGGLLKEIPSRPRPRAKRDPG